MSLARRLGNPPNGSQVRESCHCTSPLDTRQGAGLFAIDGEAFRLSACRIRSGKNGGGGFYLNREVDMKDELEAVEQDLRQWGQRQMAKLDHDSMNGLRVICDRLNDLRRRIAEAALTGEGRTW